MHNPQSIALKHNGFDVQVMHFCLKNFERNFVQSIKHIIILVNILRSSSFKWVGTQEEVRSKRNVYWIEIYMKRIQMIAHLIYKHPVINIFSSSRSSYSNWYRIYELCVCLVWHNNSSSIIIVCCGFKGAPHMAQKHELIILSDICSATLPYIQFGFAPLYAFVLWLW